MPGTVIKIGPQQIASRPRVAMAAAPSWGIAVGVRQAHDDPQQQMMALSSPAVAALTPLKRWELAARQVEATLSLANLIPVRPMFMEDHSALTTPKSRLNQALLAHRTGRLDEAERMYYEVVATQAGVRGNDDLETMQARYNLAILLEQRGDLVGAERLYRLVEAARAERLGP